MRFPAASGSSPSRSASSVVLPLPFRPVTATRSPGARSRSIGPSLKSPRSPTAPSSEATRSPGRCAAASERCSCQGSYGFSTCSIRSSDRSAWRTFPASALRPAPVGAAGGVREEHAARPRLVAAGVQERLDLAAALLGVGEGGVLPLPRQLPRRRVLAPAAGVLLDAAGPRVDLRDPGRRPVEEDTVVRDDGEPTREAVEEALEPVEPVEVEVVRRLVEQEHVEAGEQDRGQPGARRLAAGERRRLLLERDGEPELGAGRPGTAPRDRRRRARGSARAQPRTRRGSSRRCAARRPPPPRRRRYGGPGTRAASRPDRRSCSCGR